MDPAELPLSSWMEGYHARLRREETMGRRSVGLRQAGVVVLLGAAFVSGCGGFTVAQKATIGQFSRVTATIGEVTAQELSKMRDGAIQANTSTLILIGEDRAAPGETTPRTALITPATVERQFTVQNIGHIGHAARALQSYGELLLALVEDSQAKELRGAAEGLVANLKAVPDVSLQEKEEDAITSAVYAVGRVIVETKKAKAIKIIVPAAAPHIDKISGLLAAEFDPNRDGSLGSAFRAAAERLRGEGAEAFRQAKTTADRAVILPAWEYGRAASLRSDEIHKRISDTASGIQKSHRMLVEAVKSDRWTAEDVKAVVTDFDKEIQAVAKLTKELVERTGVLK